MQSISAKEAKYGFGRLIDLARAQPVTIEKHGRPVVVVLAIEEYERLQQRANGAAAPETPRVKQPKKSGERSKT
jgi:prevent-host-death family protein